MMSFLSNGTSKGYRAVNNSQTGFNSKRYNGSASIKLDVNPLLQLIAEILQVKLEGESGQRKFTVCTEQKETTIIPGLSQLIHKVTDEIWCDCEEKGNAKERSRSVMNLLSIYSPDVKVVLVLAAFAIHYGDVIVTMDQNINGSNNIVNSLVRLNELTGTLDESILKTQIQTIKETVNIVLDVVDCIMELKGFHTMDNILSEIDIDGIIFWMVTALIHCGFTVSEFYSGYNEKSELVVTNKKIQDYHHKLTTDIIFYRMREVEIQVTSNYQELFDLLRSPPAGNIDILYYFISSNIDGKILYNHESMEHTTLRSFEKNNVLILYSSFANETFKEELSLILKQLHNITNNKIGYKILWVPIDVQKTATDDKYKAIISEMSYCYTLTFEAVQKVNSGLVHLLKKDWGFTGKPMLVVLDERGRVVRQNALLMLDLYHDEAFPFTTEHENQLLANKPIGMQMLQLDEIDEVISQWIKSKGQYVCLYGGDDIKWCGKMLSKFDEFMEGGIIKVMTAYVGRNSHHKKKVEETLASFKGADLGNRHYMEHSKSTVFWESLQKFMFHFSTHDSSKVSEGFLSWASPLLTLGKSRVSWVAIGNADKVLVFTGSIFLSGLDLIFEELNEWGSEFTTDKFLEQLSVWMDKSKKNQGKQDHCHKLEIAGSPALIRGDRHCPTCYEPMQMMVLYKCCTTENSL